MKISLTVLTAIIFLLSSDIWSQENNYEDVVYLKDGSVIRGQIIEQKIGEYVKITMRNGTVVELPYQSIDKIVKETIEKNARQTVFKSGSNNKLESWYLDFALGFGASSYPTEVRRFLDQKKKDMLTTGLHFGVYWPMKDKKTLLGFALNMSMEGFKDKDLQGTRDPDSLLYTVASGGYVLSLQHFFNSYIGEGPYGRLDLGAAMVQEGYDDEPEYNSAGGYHAAAEIGYMWPIAGGGTHVSLHGRLNYSHTEGSKFVKKGDYSSYIIGIGLLW